MIDNSSGVPIIETLKDHITSEDSKIYIQQQFDEMKQNQNDIKIKRPLRALLAQKKMALINLATHVANTSAVSNLNVPFTLPNLSPIASQQIDGIKALDEVTQNVKHDLDEFDQMSASFAENLISLENSAIECKQLAELSRVLSDSSLQQLDQIHRLHSTNSILHSVFDIFKNTLTRRKA